MQLCKHVNCNSNITRAAISYIISLVFTVSYLRKHKGCISTLLCLKLPLALDYIKKGRRGYKIPYWYFTTRLARITAATITFSKWMPSSNDPTHARNLSNGGNIFLYDTIFFFKKKMIGGLHLLFFFFRKIIILLCINLLTTISVSFAKKKKTIISIYYWSTPHQLKSLTIWFIK